MTRLLKFIKRIGLYLKFYNEPEDRALRAEAYAAAKAYYAHRPVRSLKHPYPHPFEYRRRMDDFVAFQSGYRVEYRHNYAMKKLRSLGIR